MRWVGYVACIGERCIQGFCREIKGREPLGQPRHRWEDNIKWIFRKWDGRGGRGTHWIDLTQDRDRWQALVNAVRNLWVPQNVGYFLTS
jgi:hypothetical protein